MKHVIEGIRRRSIGAESRPNFTFRHCIYPITSVLGYYNPIFYDDRTYDLMRVSWSSWYHPGKAIVSASFLSQCYLNIERLFGATVESHLCSSPDEFRELMYDRVCNNRPLFLFIYGNPKRMGEEIRVTSGTDHVTFAGIGIDSAQDRVLVANNFAIGWCPIEDIGHRILVNLVDEFYVSPDCTMPAFDVLANHLLIQVSSNFDDNPVTYGDVPGRDVPPHEMICGVKGIHAFAEHPSFHRKGWSVEQTAREGITFGLLVARQERSLFISIFEEFISSTYDPYTYNGIMEYWKELSKTWVVAGKLSKRLELKGNGDVSSKFRDILHSTGEQEEKILLLLRDYLVGVLKHSKRNQELVEG